MEYQLYAGKFSVEQMDCLYLLRGPKDATHKFRWTEERIEVSIIAIHSPSFAVATKMLRHIELLAEGHNLQEFIQKIASDVHPNLAAALRKACQPDNTHGYQVQVQRHESDRLFVRVLDKTGYGVEVYTDWAGYFEKHPNVQCGFQPLNSDHHGKIVPIAEALAVKPALDYTRRPPVRSDIVSCTFEELLDLLQAFPDAQSILVRELM